MQQPFTVVDIAGYLWLLRDVMIATGLALMLWMTRGLSPPSAKRVDRLMLAMMLLEGAFHFVWLEWRRGHVEPLMAAGVFFWSAVASVAIGFVYLIRKRQRMTAVLRGGP